MTIRIHTVTTTGPGSKADYRHADYHFQRHHTGDAPAPLPPLRPLWHDIAAGALLLAAFACWIFP